MARPELGTKRTCTSCGARFYDLGKMPVECPKCETSFCPEILLPPKELPPSDGKPSGWQRHKPSGWQRQKQSEPAGEERRKKDTADTGVVSRDDVDDAAGEEDDEVAAIADVDLGDDDTADTGTKDDENTLLETHNEDNSDVVSGVSEDTKSN